MAAAPQPVASRAALLWQWLTRTFAGRAFLGGSALKILALLLRLTIPSRGVTEAVDTIGDISIVAGAVTVGYWLFVDLKRLVLWRVRRKLTLSYIFMGFVPALLIITFFLLAGLLLFFDVTQYSVRTRVASVVDETRFLAESAALELSRAGGDAQVAQALRLRHDAAVGRYPLVSYALVAGEQTCGAGTPRNLALPQVEGPWTHVPPPSGVPSWVPCGGTAALIAVKRDGVTYAIARAVEWVPSRPHEAVVVDLPLDADMLRRMGDQIGVEVGGFSTSDELGAMLADPNVPQLMTPSNGGASPAATSPRLGFLWVAVLEGVDWATGTDGRLTMQFRMFPAAVYEQISGTASLGRDFGNLTPGQGYLWLIAIVGAAFLLIQLVAVGMGVSLARSITSAVHELFEGTERVGRGDFTHRIPISSRDQLGELASSFNSMTTSIEYLLQEKAEKERLEQELRIAREIQMSLLPRGPLQVPGLALTAHCEPAREVGGDYYDYVPIDDDRIGLLIADVSGKGTSAALYMAELKGIILSLSQRHVSPRQLLINANQIISRHLDTRSFITITYAVVDLRARTLTYARAGHCPLIRVAGPYAPSRRAQILMPDGMVLGLQIDDGSMFSQALEEVTLPLGTGDQFLFYTDGLSETMNAEGDCFGDTRLAELLERHADLPPAEIRERILREVQAFAGTAAQQDDMTMLLLGVGEGLSESGRGAAAVAVS